MVELSELGISQLRVGIYQVVDPKLLWEAMHREEKHKLPDLDGVPVEVSTSTIYPTFGKQFCMRGQVPLDEFTDWGEGTYEEFLYILED